MPLTTLKSSALLGLSSGLLATLSLSAQAQVRSVDDIAPEPAIVAEAAALTAENAPPAAAPETEEATLAEADDTTDALVAQQTPDDTTPQRIKYSLGVGGTIGLSDGGDTALGDGGFSLVGRFSITDNLSVHTASVIGDDSLFTAALTGGAPIRNEENNRTLVFPFAGAGVSVETEDFDFNPFISAGVDVPITDQFTGTARINTSFDEDGADVGLVLGVGFDVFSLF